VITLPPLFFYAIGTILVVFGALRAAILGRRRGNRELTEDTPARAKERRRHLVMGIIFVLLGLMLLGTGAGVLGPHR
jgi:hypothetical protein